MTALVIVLLLVNIGFLGYFVKKWLDNAPGESKFPRGGEKPINEFFTPREQTSERPRMDTAAGIEVQEIAEQMLNRIDRKIDILRDLIRQADQKIESLSRTYHVLPSELPMTDHVPQAAAPERTQRGRQLAGGRGEAQTAGADDDKRSRIMQLRRKGMSSTQIAQEIGIGRGEVDLILNIEEMSI